MKVYRIEFERKILAELYIEAKSETDARNKFNDENYDESDVQVEDVYYDHVLEVDIVSYV